MRRWRVLVAMAGALLGCGADVAVEGGVGGAGGAEPECLPEPASCAMDGSSHLRAHIQGGYPSRSWPVRALCDGSVLLAGDADLVGPLDGQAFAANGPFLARLSSNGEVLWSRRPSAPVRALDVVPAADGRDAIYVAEDDGEALRVERLTRDGDAVWTLTAAQFAHSYTYTMALTLDRCGDHVLTWAGEAKGATLPDGSTIDGEGTVVIAFDSRGMLRRVRVVDDLVKRTLRLDDGRLLLGGHDVTELDGELSTLATHTLTAERTPTVDELVVLEDGRTMAFGSASGTVTFAPGQSNAIELHGNQCTPWSGPFCSPAWRFAALLERDGVVAAARSLIGDGHLNTGYLALLAREGGGSELLSGGSEIGDALVRLRVEPDLSFEATTLATTRCSFWPMARAPGVALVIVDGDAPSVAAGCSAADITIDGDTLPLAAGTGQRYLVGVPDR